MKRYLELSKKHFEKMKRIRRCIHKNPEIDRDLPLTCSLVRKELNAIGIDYDEFGDLGVIAQIGNSKRVVGLRADMDALKITDLKNTEYASKRKGFMHACGHDAHTSMQIGAASILKDIQGELDGSVRFIFQPAEETNGGAIDMIGYGALKDVKALFGLHVCEELETGTIGLKRGVVAAASNPFKIIVNGRGAHAASPQMGVDSIIIACKIVENLQTIVSREVAATSSVVISVCKICGGTAPNAIANTVKIEGTIRTLGNDLREKIVKRVYEIATLTANIHGGDAKVIIEDSYPSYDNDDSLYTFLSEKLINHEDIKYFEMTKPSMGVEDFAYYAKKVPSLYYRLGCRNSKKGIIHPSHGGYFDIDEECLIYGAALQAMNAVEYLKYLKKSCG